MGNTYAALETAFSDDAIDDLVDNGAFGSGAFASEGSACLNLDVGLGNWKNAIVTNARNHVVVIGDSNSAGAETFRWPAQLALALQTFTSRPAGGPGFRHLGLPEWTVANGWTQVASGLPDVAPNGFAYQASGPGASSPLLTWAPPAGLIAHDRFIVYAVDPGSIGVGDLDYSVNGGAFTSTAFNYTPTTYNLVANAPVVGTIASNLRLRANNPFGPTIAAGVAFYNGDGTNGPLIVHNLAQGGADTDQMAGSTEPRPDTGMTSPLFQSPIGVGDRLKIIDTLQPKLTILCVGGIEFLNYYNAPLVGTKQQMQLAKFEANVNRMAAKARLYGDCLIVSPHGLIYPDSLANNPLNIQQRDYARVARNVAWRNDCAYINMKALWGKWARINARGWMTDGLHINSIGHTKMASFLARTITRVS